MRLTAKLSLSFLIVSLIGIVLVALLARGLVQRQIGDFATNLNRELLAEQLGAYYAEAGSWRGLGDRRLAPAFDQFDWNIIDANGRPIFSRRGPPVTAEALRQATPIVVDGAEVGALIVRPSQRTQQAIAQQNRLVELLRTVSRLLLLGAIGAALISLVVGFFFARQISGPLKRMTEAARRITAGDLTQQVAVESNDEVGELALAFNQMSAQLAQQQLLRKQMSADIAHDLRTPLSIILGHTEGLLDGILPADQNTFALLHDESLRLSRLIEDLRTLSLADAGELPLVKTQVDVAELLQRSVHAHQPRAYAQHIQLQFDGEHNLPRVWLDADRITQVLDNLIANALRYTPAGGVILLSAAHIGDAITISVSDNGQGMSAEQLERVFDRFYRADSARRRDGSGSGLGLAISKSLVQQHGGSISVESAPARGAVFRIRLPIAHDPRTASS